MQKEDSGGEHQKQIPVFIDGKMMKIPDGEYVVSGLKEVLGVAADRVLEIKGKELIPLQDDQTIQVHEGEKFASHVRKGGSS